MDIIKLINEIVVDEYYSRNLALKNKSEKTLKDYDPEIIEDYSEYVKELLQKHQSKQYLTQYEIDDLAHMYIFLLRRNFSNPQTREKVLNDFEIQSVRKFLIDRNKIITT